MLKNSRTAYWSNFCSKLTYDSKLGSVWNTIKILSGSGYKGSRCPTSGLTSFDNDKDKANGFAVEFSNFSSNNNLPTNFNVLRAETVKRYLPSIADISSLDNSAGFNVEITLTELLIAILACSNKSSSGPDNVS